MKTAKKLVEAVVGLTIIVLMGFDVNMLAACANPGPVAKTAEQITVRVAADVCQEEANQPSDPAWVLLACKTAKDIVHVLFPTAQWSAIKSRAVVVPARPAPDAGAP